MSFYSYSVKSVLKDFFGENTVFSMRRPRGKFHKNDEKKDLLQELAA